MSDQETFTSKYAIDASAGYDVSKLEGKSVVITGGASGLGEEMMRHFVKANAFVTFGDISEADGRRLLEELGEDKVAFCQCDVLIWDAQVSLFKTALAKAPSKQIDIVVANAGISGQDAVWRNDAENPEDEPIEPDLRIVKTNLIGVMYTAKLAVHYLNRNPEGSDRCLIMTASLAGYLDMPGSPQYGASKWGVRGMMRSLRRTGPKMDVRVNIIAPWFIKTRIMSEGVVERLQERGTQFAEIGDAATAVLHISSDTSMNGRACAIVPRDWAPKGYMDLEKDDNADDDVVSGWQKLVTNAGHRTRPE